jgi:hypothetical protein
LDLFCNNRSFLRSLSAAGASSCSGLDVEE